MDRRQAQQWLRDREIYHYEQQRLHDEFLWLERMSIIMQNDYTVKLQYQGYNVEVTTQLKRPEDLGEWLALMANAGYTKPVYEKKDKAEVPQGQGIVRAVNLSSRKYNGKPMYDIIVEQADGKQYTYQKFNKNEFRANDDVWCFNNDKGYPDVTLDFPEGTQPIPF